jgi:hypothetical protein
METHLPFAAWKSFYVIVGSSAGALTGLMFLVIALLIDFRRAEQLLDAFATPTVAHFSSVLLLSAIMSAPWPVLWGARLAPVSATTLR